MSGPVLRLKDFGLTDLSIHWRQAEAPKTQLKSRLSVGYLVQKLSDEPSNYKVRLTVRDERAAAADQVLATVKVTAVGFFPFPESATPEERERLIRVNGLPVLYSSLRGALLSVSGLFPPGFRYLPPTVNMLELIKSVEGKATEKVRLRKGHVRQTALPPENAAPPNDRRPRQGTRPSPAGASEQC